MHMKKNRIALLTMAAFFIAALTFVSCGEDEKPAPVSDFTFEIDDKTVTFTNTSTNATSYSWDFGDNTLSVEKDPPAHVYDAYGDYDVRLTAMGEGGEIIKKQTISVVKEWPAIAIDGSFGDWDAVESFYSGYGDASGSLMEAKVTSDAAGSKIYVYIKGTINADFPVIQIMINADGDTITGWKTPLDYNSNGSEYQFEFYALDGWAGVYSWSTDPGIQDWPWEDDITSNPDDGDITETSGVIGGTEIEFAIETSLMKNPVVADEIGIYFWMQPEDWSATSGSLPPIMAEPTMDVKMFSFQ
jgi:PKD repeat protein